MGGGVNLIAGLLVLFWMPYVTAQNIEYILLIVLLIVLFFAFYVARLRFVPAVCASLIYFSLYQYILLTSTLAQNEISILTLIAWTAILFAYTAGYNIEVTNRTLFTQQKMIDSQQEQLQYEHQKSEALLNNVLPSLIAQRLKNEEGTIADAFAETSILFADIVGFTALSQQLQPKQLVEMLDTLFSRFDQLVDQYGLEKIKTIGDGYMVASGIPLPRSDHAEALALFALAMGDALADYNIKANTQLQLRIGMNSGSVVAGVIGKRRFIYDLWGDSVNTASRMESHGEAGKIQVSEATQRLLVGKFKFVERGMVDVKGIGMVKAYFLLGFVDPD